LHPVNYDKRQQAVRMNCALQHYDSKFKTPFCRLSKKAFIYGLLLATTKVSTVPNYNKLGLPCSILHGRPFNSTTLFDNG